MTNNIKVTVTRIIGTKVTVYTAWEPYAGHSTFTHIDGVRYGQVGTAPLPAQLNKLPAMSEERYVQVKAWINAQYQRAYAIIKVAHPEAVDGRPDMGQLEVVS